MARSTSSAQTPPKTNKLKQFWAVMTMTRKHDPAVVWLMLGAVLLPVVVGYLVGLAVGHSIYVAVLGLMVGVLLAILVLGRRAERAAVAQVSGQPGAALWAMQNMRRGWNVEEQPVAVDPRSQDMVFRAVGRPGVVLVTEGNPNRLSKMVETERRRTTKLVSGVPVHVLNVGDAKGQTSLRKLPRSMAKLKPALSKTEVAEVSRRLHAMGALKPPVPKGVDPMRMRPDRKAMRGR